MDNSAPSYIHAGPLGTYGVFSSFAVFATVTAQPGEVFTAMQVPPSTP